MVTPDRMWSLALALVGTLIGAFVTFVVQTLLKRQDTRKAIKDRLVTFIMITTRIESDMATVQQLLDFYKKQNPPGAKPWESIHLLHLTPGYKPDLMHLEVLTKLKSGKLVTIAMDLVKEYTSMIETIERYNDLRSDFVEKRRDPDFAKDRLEIVVRNMVEHVAFIDKTTKELMVQSKEVQLLVHEKSKGLFGNGDFLKLPQDY